MIALSYIKRKAFWIKDLFHRREVRNKYFYLKNISEDSISGRKKQRIALDSILHYAFENTKFYSQFNPDDIYSFPIVNKNILNKYHDDIVVSRDLIPNQRNEVFIQRTSGSTGTPLAVPQDTQKRKRRIAELKYYNDTVGLKSHEMLMQCRIWTRWHKKNNWQIFCENIIPVQVLKIGEDTVSDLFKMIRKKRIKAVRAYASVFDRFLDFLESHPERIDDLKTLKVCFSTSESLNPVVKERWYKRIGILIVETYGSEETGTLGHQLLDINDANFYLNHAGYFFEFLKLESDVPAEYGELSRVVVTDLYNHAFPMIRYDTGDTAIVEKGNERSHGWDFISRLYGRRMDLVYDIEGNPIHPMTFARILKNYEAIIQWQFIQKGRNEYQIRLALGGCDVKAIEKDLNKELHFIVGENAKIEFKYVNEIPILASGKRKMVVCELEN